MEQWADVTCCVVGDDYRLGEQGETSEATQKGHKRMGGEKGLVSSQQGREHQKNKAMRWDHSSVGPPGKGTVASTEKDQIWTTGLRVIKCWRKEECVEG